MDRTDIGGQLPTDPEVVGVLASSDDGVIEGQGLQVIQIAMPGVFHLAVVSFKNIQEVKRKCYHTCIPISKGKEFLL